MRNPISQLSILASAFMFLAGCLIGPRYQRPSVDTPAAFKELTAAQQKRTDGWKVAHPGDDTLRGDWWKLFDDPELTALEEKVNANNQSVLSAAATFEAARALVRQAQSQLYPSVTANLGITTARESSTATGVATGVTGGTIAGAGTATGSASTAGVVTSGTHTLFSAPLEATWTPDLWGSIRNSINTAADSAQADAATLQNTRLTIQTEVAQDYFQLRGEDSMKQILDSTVTAYQKTLDLTKALYQTGIDQQSAVAVAQNNLQTVQAQDAAVAIARAQYEHAIAVLVGQPASTFHIPEAPLKVNPPAIPYGVPSQLLERRPDISASERLVAQANAQIGIGQAAFFPTVTLSASGGFESTSLSNWFTWPARFFSVGPGVSEPIFDAGLRAATVEQYTAQYNGTVANYRQTVLTAFQQVEDNLVSLRVLSDEIGHEDAAVNAARQNYDAEVDRFLLGIDPYLNVLTAQTTLLTSRQTQLNLQIQQMTSSAALIEALGGGWNASSLPKP